MVLLIFVFVVWDPHWWNHQTYSENCSPHPSPNFRSFMFFPTFFPMVRSLSLTWLWPASSPPPATSFATFRQRHGGDTTRAWRRSWSSVGPSRTSGPADVCSTSCWVAGTISVDRQSLFFLGRSGGGVFFGWLGGWVKWFWKLVRWAICRCWRILNTATFPDVVFTPTMIGGRKLEWRNQQQGTREHDINVVNGREFAANITGKPQHHSKINNQTLTCQSSFHFFLRMSRFKPSATTSRSDTPTVLGGCMPLKTNEICFGGPFHPPEKSSFYDIETRGDLGPLGQASCPWWKVDLRLPQWRKEVRKTGRQVRYQISVGRVGRSWFSLILLPKLQSGAKVESCAKSDRANFFSAQIACVTCALELQRGDVLQDSSILGWLPHLPNR